MAKYIYNPTLSDRVYEGRTVAAESYYYIQPNLESEFMMNTDLITDLAALTVKMSADGVTPIDGDGATQVAFLMGQDLGPKDIDNAALYRLKMAPAGWTYQLLSLEVTTSLLNSLVSLHRDGTSRGDATIKFFNASDVELTDQTTMDSTCTKTVFEFEPSYDYEIIGGFVSIADQPVNDVRMWVVAVPDVPAAYGGSKVMANGPNFKFKTMIETDGRVAKRLSYDATNHTNKLQFVIKHTAGEQHNLMLNLEFYKV